MVDIACGALHSASIQLLFVCLSSFFFLKNKVDIACVRELFERAVPIAGHDTPGKAVPPVPCFLFSCAVTTANVYQVVCGPECMWRYPDVNPVCIAKPPNMDCTSIRELIVICSTRVRAVPSDEVFCCYDRCSGFVPNHHPGANYGLHETQTMHTWQQQTCGLSMQTRKE